MPTPDRPDPLNPWEILESLDLLPPPGPPDLGTSTSYDQGKDDLDQARQQAEIEDLIQDRDQRKVYGTRLFRLMVSWLCGVFIVIVLSGFNLFSFKLSTTVLTTLIGSTTASVLGLFAIVANYLFPRREKD